MSGTDSVSVDVETLKENISELKYELAHYKTTNEDLVSKLAKAERQLSKVNDYNEELRIQLEKLSKEVHQYRKTAKLANDKLSSTVCTGAIGVQVCADDFEIVFESKALPSWDTQEKVEDNVIDTSCIADALKATAEAALYGQADSTTHIGNQTGKSYDSTQYVYDETSQMYYDYNSGYYIDTQNNLYYDPKSGTYFYYDTTTQTYEFHSQIDISQNPTPTKPVEVQFDKRGRREKRKTHKKKDEKKHKKHKRTRSESTETSKKSRKKSRKEKKRERSHEHRERKTSESRKGSASRKEKTSLANKNYSPEAEDENVIKDLDDFPVNSGAVSSLLSVLLKDKSELEHRDLIDPTLEKTKCESESMEVDDIMLLDEITDSNKNTNIDSVEKCEPKKPNICTEDNLKDREIETVYSEKEITDSSEVVYVSDGDSDGICTGESELESGELSSDSSSDSDSDNDEDIVIEGDGTIEILNEFVPYTGDEKYQIANEASASWPPCIRAIVQVSDCFDVGDLSIITCTGGIVGREKGKNHVIMINDLNISRNHCSIWFDYDNNNYMVKDEGSQHGTYINTTRLSQPNKVSHEAAVNHGDIMKVGSTEFLLHIHPGNDTCLDCEPGEVKARVKKDEPNNIVILSAAEKKKQKKAELNTIKKRYGLKNMAYEDNNQAINNPAYEDKAAVRRKKVGSDGPGHKAEAPASVHKPISGKNVGHKLLSKMGWKEGEGLGKSSSGIVDPINVNYRSNKAAGLGSSVSIEQPIDNIDGRSVRKVNMWRQAQERYDKIDETLRKTPQDSESQNEIKVPESESKTMWVKGDTQNPTEQSENT
ncbi:angiogenic factor with G patch and FHA domains 1 isoform X2 [Patella vulgata]|uniref:angiogenic factor with G patch and FHA domains 1 isoform X2 n=1 Tax=Patella vulgata TaxID=6465 RepID=UPI0024A95E44|nr:angiogenic factor with G patch and FHA domains 1 isoform X2 [Patella vulgata]